MNTPSRPYYTAFTPTKAGTIDEIKAYVGTADTGKNILVGIYDSVDGMPENLISTTTLSVDSTGVSSASPDATTTLAVGTQYWCGYVEDGSANSAKIYGCESDVCAAPFPQWDSDLFSLANQFYHTSGTQYALPDPVDLTTVRPLASKHHSMRFTYT